MPDSNLADLSVLTSAFWNTYVREQVTVTCTSATRPTAVEGRLIYETDTDRVMIYNGSAWVPFGSGSAWSTWTPTVTQAVAVTVSVTRARYAQLGKVVHFNAVLAVTGAGSGGTQISMSLPVTAQASGFIIGGAGYITDASASLNYHGLPYLTSTTGVGLSPTTVGVGFGLLGAVGFTAALANTDTINISGTYEAA
jgi:hypothetical protein